VSYLLSTFYALLTDGPLVSRPVSRKSRLATFVFPGKTVGFAVEVVGFELGKFES
jgi:acyl dehydratase